MELHDLPKTLLNVVVIVVKYEKKKKSDTCFCCLDVNVSRSRCANA